MFRYQLIFTCCLFLLGSWFAPAQVSFAQEKEIKTALESDIKQLSEMPLEDLLKQLDEIWIKYEQQLRAVVEARLVEEREFVAQVTLLIQQDQLPKQLVDSSWQWVRTRRPGTNSPFVYFERVLRLRAEKAGFLIPPFDDRIYSLSKTQRELLQQKRAEAARNRKR